MDLNPLVKNVSENLRLNHLKLATAESCTGGLIASLITDLAGSSDIFDRGFVTYSNQSKMDLLGVYHSILDAHGAVSEQTAQAMAEGALRQSMADIALSVTGIAGPSGGSEAKPVGLVYIGLAHKINNHHASPSHTVRKNLYSGTRTQIRYLACETALEMVQELLQKI
jgi:nicotinamide-nucleotide amidase